MACCATLPGINLLSVATYTDALLVRMAVTLLCGISSLAINLGVKVERQRRFQVQIGHPYQQSVTVASHF